MNNTLIIWYERSLLRMPVYFLVLIVIFAVTSYGVDDAAVMLAFFYIVPLAVFLAFYVAILIATIYKRIRQQLSLSKRRLFSISAKVVLAALPMLFFMQLRDSLIYMRVSVQSPEPVSKTCAQQPDDEANTIEITSAADKFFQSADFEKYVGRAVGELLNDIPFRCTESSGFDEPPGRLIGVSYAFEGGYKVSVRTLPLRYTKRFDEKMQWDLKYLALERITGIEVRRFAPRPYSKVYGAPLYR